MHCITRHKVSLIQLIREAEKKSNLLIPQINYSIFYCFSTEMSTYSASKSCCCCMDNFFHAVISFHFISFTVTWRRVYALLLMQLQYKPRLNTHIHAKVCVTKFLAKFCWDTIHSSVFWKRFVLSCSGKWNIDRAAGL